MQVTTIATSSRNEPIVTAIEEFEPIKGGIELAIVSCTLPLPIEPMEVPIIVVNIKVETLEELIVQNPYH